MADFLNLENVLTLYAGQVASYGGDHRVRDSGLLESAIAHHQATFGGECLHKDLFEMAAA
jgi:death-on-curing protein